MIKDIYLIHECHTDIGYTNAQGRILRWYAAFTKQAIEIAEKDPAFRWTCETFLQVEYFWQHADESWRKRFLDLVRANRIGLSANWGNFNELPDEAIFGALASRARRFADEHQLPLNIAILADINGCPLSYARALADAGITFLLPHVHPHHGCVPLRKRIQPFWWDLGDGRKMLVYHHDHYHVGNELGFFPGAEHSYMTFREPIQPFDDDILERRLAAYMHGVEEAGWPYDFLVFTGSGLITDNSPPSQSVTGRIARWNADPAHTVKIQMITAGDLPGILMERTSDLPTYSGDWPDWWSDGSAGDPEGTILYRQAQRERRWLSAMGTAFPQTAVPLDSLDTALGFFAEHTYGHSASLNVPWNPLAQQLHVRKMGFVGEAADIADCLGEQATEALGYGPLAYGRPLRFLVANPYDEELRQPVEIDFDGSEVHFYQLNHTLEIVDTATNQVIPHQSMPSLRGIKVLLQISVPARSTCELFIRTLRVELVQTLKRHGTCGHRDLSSDPGNLLALAVKTDDAYLEWDNSGRLLAWRDAKSGRALSGTPGDAFVLEMNRSPAAKEGMVQYHRRGAMARNRQASDSQQFVAKPTHFRHLLSGPLFDVVGIDYEAPGFELLKAEWTVHRGLPLVDIEVICHKIGTWDPENVYCPLPFTAGDGSAFWIDRGLAMRPWQDQLPGTLTDFYGTQDGIAWCADGFGVAVAMLDSHLIQCGDLCYRPRRLMGDEDLPATPDRVYSWLMTNYWETNFSAEVGGFYSFRFRVSWGEHLAEPTAALRWARRATAGLRAIRQAR